MEPEAGSPLSEGIRLLKAGSLADAQARLLDAVALDDGNPQARMYLGICMVQRGETSAGLACLRDAAHLAPADAGVLYNLAAALLQTGQSGEASVVLGRVVELDPENAKARSALASLATAATQDAPTVTEPVPAEAAAWPGAETPAPDSPWPGTGAPVVQAPPSPVQASATARGMHAAAAAPVVQNWREPTAGEMIARGLGWGLLYGQVWTGLNLFWSLVWGGVRGDSDVPRLFVIIVMAIIFAVVFSVAGTITGLVIGVGKLDVARGALAGIVMGLLLMGVEYLTSARSPAIFVNIFFWYFTGKLVGSGIAARVNRPVTT